MEKIIRVSVPSPTPGGSPVTGQTMMVVLQSLINQITTELLHQRVKNFKIDKQTRSIQIHFEVEEGGERRKYAAS